MSQRDLGVGGTAIVANIDYHLRPVRAGRDMPAILDLVEIGFRHELDPQGWKMLNQMRRITQTGSVGQVITNAGTDIAGFVCVADATVVGNLSLRQASPRTRQGCMIGNVVVHPDYRGQGIGRALMLKGIAAARRQGAEWVGLEVRASNTVACTLYEHLGFRAVGTMQHMLRPSGRPWPRSNHSEPAWRGSKPRHSDHWRRLSKCLHPHDQRLVLETATHTFRFGGLERRLNQWLSGQAERAWIYEPAADRVPMAVRVQTDRRYKFHVWELLMDPTSTQARTDEMVNQCLVGTHRFPTWPVIAMVPDYPALLDSLRAVGFELHRTLQQMILML